MLKTCYILGCCAILAACGVLGLWLSERSRDGLRLQAIRSRPRSIRPIDRRGEDRVPRVAEVSPVVAQAEAFARLLVPPKITETELAPPSQKASLVSTPSLASPPVSVLRLRVHATSCYSSRPARSMALVSIAGTAEGTERWVKEGSQVGHFLIHEIRQDGIVYRDGDQLREMAVESIVGPTSIVQDVRRGAGRSVAAAKDATVPLPSPVEPNGAAAGEN